MKQSISEIITAGVERAPAWLRQDFASKDPQVRARAEDAMAAMLAEAIAQARGSDEQE